MSNCKKKYLVTKPTFPHGANITFGFNNKLFYYHVVQHMYSWQMQNNYNELLFIIFFPAHTHLCILNKKETQNKTQLYIKGK